MNRLNQMLYQMIEREELLPEIIKNAPSISTESEFPGFSQLKMYTHCHEVYFCINNSGINFVLTPEEMKAFICHTSESRRKSLEKMIKERIEPTPKRKLYTGILIWLREHPRICKKLFSPFPGELTENIKNTFGCADVQNAPFNLFEKLPDFITESSALDTETLNGLIDYTERIGSLMSRSINKGLSRTFIWTLTQQKVVSYFDQIVILFREELGVRSLKEIESMESAFCYLLYRSDWIDRNLLYPSGAKRLVTWNKTKEYECRNLNKTVYEFFSDTNGFDGELWASYEEFMHDEWLDDNLPETFSELLNGSLHKELYTKLRNIALEDYMPQNERKG